MSRSRRGLYAAKHVVEPGIMHGMANLFFALLLILHNPVKQMVKEGFKIDSVVAGSF